MRFAVVSAFLPVEEIAPIAVAADELGYAGLTVADHVVDLETLATPYPYEASGQRRWDHDCAWPDPWVLVADLAMRTTRLRFFTSIYVGARPGTTGGSATCARPTRRSRPCAGWPSCATGRTGRSR